MKKMVCPKIHYIKHVCFEDLAGIRDWAVRRRMALTCTDLYAGENFPPLETFDWLIVLGGPMNVDDHERYPWLCREKSFIREAIDARKTILGICLGAQLIAEVLGARVIKNRVKEVGWHLVRMTAEGRRHPLLKTFPDQFPALHWHGDQFEIPPGCQRLALSDGCPNQAFACGDRILGLQFHLEYAPESVQTMCRFCPEDLMPGKYIQNEKEMLARSENFLKTQTLLDVLLTNMMRAMTAHD